jgi:RNA polymerase sigma factor (sigma-70 family)
MAPGVADFSRGGKPGGDGNRESRRNTGVRRADILPLDRRQDADHSGTVGPGLSSGRRPTYDGQVMRPDQQPSAWTPETDDDLVRRYAGGDDRAAALLVARHLPAVFRQACRWTGGDRAEAEDIAQEAFLRLWRAAGRWRPGEARLSTWLYAVTRNLAIDRWRRIRRVGTLLPLERAGEVADPSSLSGTTAGRDAQRDALEQALHGLPDAQRMAVVLRHVEGLSNPEIADILSVSVAAVESLIARGKRGLVRRLAEKRKGDGDA